MDEKEYTGSASKFRKSEFIDATEDLIGRTRKNPCGSTVESGVLCNNVTDKDGKTENGVFALRLEKSDRRLRMNATKRKIMIAATGTTVVKDWAGTKLRLYQTVDSDRTTGGKTSVKAVAIDVQNKAGEWLRYLDYQQPRGKALVKAAGLDSAELA